MKFNTTVKKVLPNNLAGGQAHAQSAELELLSILVTSFVEDGYYRTATNTLDRVKELLPKVDPHFAAQAIVYGRTKYGMRSISHAVASDLAKYITGVDWGKDFYKAVVHRPDDMLEILSYHKANNGKVPAAMKKGFANAFDKFDNYQLAKWRGENKGVKLIDVVNLVHPIAIEQNVQALRDLVAGTLKSVDTWESGLSAAGNDAEAKSAVWVKLVREKKLGYLALLRNLKNIMLQAPEVLTEALDSLTNEGFIKKSLIFPFQYLIAFKQFIEINTKEARQIAEALSVAIDISCNNVKELNFDGNTLVAIDNSGSMTNRVGSSPHMQMSELGALFGIVLAKAINADVMEFGDNARYIPYRLSEPSINFAALFSGNNRVGHGTNFQSIFDVADKKYNRVLIFSDMQGWAGYYKPNTAAYKARTSADPFIYSFDLAGLGTMQFPENKTFALAGFSDKVLNTLKMLETDKNALLNEVKAIKF